MKNIILIDRRGENVDYILEERDYTIQVLLVENSTLKNKYSGNKRIKQIITSEEVYDFNNLDFLDLSLIEKMRETQRKVEFAMHRFILDSARSSYIYNNSLSFWNGIFLTNHVDFIVSCSMEHGFVIDTVPLDLAVFFNIPSFTYSVSMGMCWWLFHKNKEIPLKLVDTETEVDNSVSFKCLEKDRDYEVEFPLWKKVAGRNMIFSNFIMVILKLNPIIKSSVSSLPYNYFTKLKYYLQIKSMKRYYQSLAVKPNFKEKFIYFALHKEPEASTNVVLTLQNQVTALKMLSDNLPKGWKIYIKEHPDQYNVNRIGWDHFILNMTYFKNKWFYEKINSFKNVKIIKMSYPSIELIDRCEAVATLNGTVGIEAAQRNKHVLMFEEKHSLLSLIEGLTAIKSVKSLKDKMSDILNQNNPNYTGINKIKKYVFVKERRSWKYVYDTIEKELIKG